MFYLYDGFGLFELIISGSMFAGKTQTLLARLDVFKHAGKDVRLYCPVGSQRYGAQNEVVTHSLIRAPAQEIETTDELVNLVKQIETPSSIVMGIDEVMLFDEERIVDNVNWLVNNGVIIIASGLTLYSEGQPFGHMPYLLSIADAITYLYGVCHSCGGPATRSKAIFNKKEKKVVGADYIPLCRRCWQNQ